MMNYYWFSIFFQLVYTISADVYLTEEDIHKLEINTIARKLRLNPDNETNCLSMIQLFMTNLDILDVELHSIVHVNENAVNAALDLDNTTVKGKLHCVPMIVADNIPVKNMPMSLGVDLFTDSPIEFETGPVVRNLVSQGAVILGKTNIEPLGLPGLNDASQKEKSVRNPYGAKYRSGYSNGGVAAAIAARMAVIGIGSDTGGDGLVAASDSNVVSVRLPSDLISFDTLFPTVVYQDALLFYALSVKDITTMIDAVTGQTLPYFTVFEKEQAKILSWGILSNMTWQTQINITYPNVNVTWNVDPEITSMVMDVVSELRKKQIAVMNSTSDIIPTLSSVLPYQNQISACFSDWMGAYLSGHIMKSITGPVRTFDVLVKQIKLPEASIKTLEWLLSQKDNCTRANANLLGARQKLRATFDPIFERIDILMFPATISSPFLVMEKQVNLNITFGSHYPGSALPAILGYPAITVPIGFRKDESGSGQGLPVSIILMARPNKFKFLLQAAQFYQTEVTPSLKNVAPLVLKRSTYSSVISNAQTHTNCWMLTTILYTYICYCIL